MTVTYLPKSPGLPVTTGRWRAIYWEPVANTTERLCVGCLTEWKGQVHQHRFLRSDLLIAMYGANASKVSQMLDKGLALSTALAKSQGFEFLAAPFANLALGRVFDLHANAENELVRAAILMASSFGKLSEPATLQAEDLAEENTVVNRQFISRVRDRVIKLRPDLSNYFNKEAVLKSQASTVKFGFLSDKLVAHLGLVQVSRMQHYVRNARGLMSEINLAQNARGRTGNSCLILGAPPLTSPTLTDKERAGLEAVNEELRLECEEYSLGFAWTESDEQCADILISFAG